MAVFASAASAVTIIDQNFDDTTVFPTNTGITVTGDNNSTIGRWAQNDGTPPVPTPLVDPAPSYVGDQSVQVTRTGGGTTGFLGYRGDGTSINLATDPSFIVQFSVYRDTATSSFIANANNSGTFQSNVPLAIYVDSAGGINTQFYPDGGWVTRGDLVIPQATWTQVELAVNTVDHTYDLFATVGAGPTTQLLDNYGYVSATLGNVNGIAFLPQVSTFQVDDVFVGTEAIPEPAMTSILLLGSGLVLTRRRQR
jgi:hypothetical protein